MGAAVEQFRRTLADSLGPFAPQEAAVVGEELEQGQVIRSQVAAEEEVVAQPAVEVLDQRTGADRLAVHFGPATDKTSSRSHVSNVAAYARFSTKVTNDWTVCRA
ncbi:MAG TPA: hypothetical protein VMY42_19890 [Thermoguttaceae bacterium]|nr:hypothetical protein [Thermoguttaceae bacterium]